MGVVFLGDRLFRVPEAIARKRGQPAVIVMDNGPKFRGRALDARVCHQGVRLRFIGPGKPQQNRLLEGFNDKFRAECLNSHWFTDLEDRGNRLEAWRRQWSCPGFVDSD